MNILLFANSGVLFPLNKLVQWLVSTKRPTPVFQERHRDRIATNVIACRAIPTRVRSDFCLQKSAPNRPLRVVRVMEAGQTSASVGRMVISGRMADVCAELDRLAAREAALS